MARNFSRSSGRDSSTALSVAPCSTTGLTTWLHHDCAGQDGVNVFARRFTRIPRAWVFADMCKSVDPSPPAPTPVAPRLLLELVGPAALSAIASEIKGIEVRRHDDPDGGPQIDLAPDAASSPGSCARTGWITQGARHLLSRCFAIAWRPTSRCCWQRWEPAPSK